MEIQYAQDESEVDVFDQLLAGTKLKKNQIQRNNLIHETDFHWLSLKDTNIIDEWFTLLMEFFEKALLDPIGSFTIRIGGGK